MAISEKCSYIAISEKFSFYVAVFEKWSAYSTNFNEPISSELNGLDGGDASALARKAVKTSQGCNLSEKLTSHHNT